MPGLGEGIDAVIEAVQHCRQIELPISVRDLSDIGEGLLVWIFCGKARLDEVFRLFCLTVSSGNAIGVVLSPNSQMMFPADAIDSASTASVSAMQPQLIQRILLDPKLPSSCRSADLICQLQRLLALFICIPGLDFHNTPACGI